MQKKLFSKYVCISLLLVTAFAGVFIYWPSQKSGLVCPAYRCQVHEKKDSLRISSLHGEAIITEPVLLDLLKTPVMERLKGINQGGVCHFAKLDLPPFNRYEHSLDVFLLLRKYGATLEEQIAGLLHDASHTVFSHVGDFLFKHNSAKCSYQDNIHEWFLKEYGIQEVLAKHGYNIEDILHKSGDFPLLEQDLPNLCADRIQYNYHTGYIDGLITADQVRQGYKHLHYEKGIWFFDNAEDAARLARISLHETVHYWGSAWNMLVYEWTAQAMRRAMHLGLVSVEEIHFNIQDDEMWNRLVQSDDPMIQYLMHRVQHYEEQFYMLSEDDFENIAHDNSIICQNIRFKNRGIDPFVKTEEGLKRLSALDPLYALEYAEVDAHAKKGFFIAFKKNKEKSETEQMLCAAAESLIHAQEGKVEKAIVRLT